MKLKPWIQASRLPSQSYIFFPLLFGQGISAVMGEPLNWSIFILTHIYGLLIQLYIVFANDLADVSVDETNTTFNIFSGGSRALVDGLITKTQMKTAVILTLVLNSMIALAMVLVYQRFWFVLLLVLSWLLLWFYSYPPVKLSYRGGGEILQMLGVGLLLPLIGFYNQSGSVVSFPWLTLIYLLPIHLGAAMTTSIPDEPSDRQGDKQTSAVKLGATKVKLLILALYSLSFSLFLLNSFLGWSLFVRLGLLTLPVLLMLAASIQVKDSPAGSNRSNRFTALMVGSVVLFMAGLGLMCLV